MGGMRVLLRRLNQHARIESAAPTSMPSFVLDRLCCPLSKGELKYDHERKGFISTGANVLYKVTQEEQSSISWNITAETKNGKLLLQNVFGFANAGKIHAILGPSGSGKTTLLNALAAQIPKGSLILTGSVAVSKEFDPVFIQQEDILFAQLTSKETLDISYKLRKEDSAGAKDATVGKLLNSLGLKKVADTKVGDKKTRGLSGGEKKRLDIGNEIVDSGMDANFATFASSGTSLCVKGGLVSFVTP
eukprot:gene37574-45639_t